MQDTHTNELVTADDIDALRRKVPEEDQGPTFEVGDVLRLKGYYYRVERLVTNEIVLAPHGRSKSGHPTDGGGFREEQRRNKKARKAARRRNR